MAAEFTFSSGWKADVARQARTLLESLGPQMVADAQRGVPILSGDLRNSIGYGTAIENDEAVMAVYADTPYAAFVELGTSRMAAQPYLRPAVFRRW